MWTHQLHLDNVNDNSQTISTAVVFRNVVRQRARWNASTDLYDTFIAILQRREAGLEQYKKM